MRGGCYRNCLICGKTFFSEKGRRTCSDKCYDLMNARTNLKNTYKKRIQRKKESGIDASADEKLLADLMEEINAIPDEVIPEEDLYKVNKKRESCMFCPKVSTGLCGQSKYTGSLTGGRYTKVPDGRCKWGV